MLPAGVSRTQAILIAVLFVLAIATLPSTRRAFSADVGAAQVEQRVEAVPPPKRRPKVAPPPEPEEDDDDEADAKDSDGKAEKATEGAGKDEDDDEEEPKKEEEKGGKESAKDEPVKKDPGPPVDDPVAKATADCLADPKSYKDGCWFIQKRRMALQTLKAMSELPPEKRTMFDFVGERKGWAVFDALFTPTLDCDLNKFERFGGGDGGKWSCGELGGILQRSGSRQMAKFGDRGANKPACIVYSLGCNGNFHFEHSIAGHTRGGCETHTFDCTGTWQDGATEMHKICVGPPKTGMNAAEFSDLPALAKQLGHKYITAIKMDVEAAEYDVLEMLLKKENQDLLPVILWVELHTHSPDLANFNDSLPKPYLENGNWFEHLYRIYKLMDEYGYALVAKERNYWDPAKSNCCSEFSWVRVEAIQGWEGVQGVDGFGSRWDDPKIGITLRYPDKHGDIGLRR
ncbi:methyltransferase domain-containing protein [Hyaloraphidium curvatum]|nr:methyltransferase domain-containing protein [Hyaloraphidium curvatum]